MANLVTRILLFLSSYFPLSVIFFVLYFHRNFLTGLIILLVSALGVVSLFLYLLLAKKLTPITVKLVTVQRRDGEAMSYIVTYLIPFLSIPSSDWQQSLSLIIFFIVLGVLYVNSNMIHINPMLNLFGYHLYEISVDDGSVRSIVTRRRLRRNADIRVVEIGEDIYLERPA